METGIKSNLHTECIVCGSTDLSEMKGYEKHGLYKCGNCGMVFMKRIPTLEELSNHYKNYSYDREVFVSPVTIKRYNELLDQFEPCRKNNLLLDIGCGVGLFLKVAIDRGWKVYGTEYSDRAIEICEAKGINMKKGELKASDFGDMKFDVITSFEVIEHINNPNKEMENTVSLMRPGGLFYCTTPNFNSLARHYVKADYNILNYPEHLSYYTPGTLDFLCKKYGLKTRKIVTTGISFSRISNSMQAEPAKPIVGKESVDENIRQKVENNRGLNTLKKVVNRSLTLLGVGSDLKGYFKKPMK